MFLARTVQDVIEHCEADTEIIVVCDGNWPDPPLAMHPRVHLIWHPHSIGQRAAVNEAARVSRAKYVMKLDAHCAVDQGFDRKLITPYESGELGPNVASVPAQYNWHIFNWRCASCGHETYQGPTPLACARCKGTGPFERVIYWDNLANGIPGRPVRSEFWRFDHELHFAYWGRNRDPLTDKARPGYHRRPEAKGDLADTMSLLGACFFMRRDRFWELGGMDNGHGSWGQMGTEVACKAWLSGGRLVTNKRTWFGHTFRTQGGDFGMPYPLSGKEQDAARTYSRQLWMNNAWPGQIRPLEWLIEKFAPIPGWHDPIGVKALKAVNEAGSRFPGVVTQMSQSDISMSENQVSAGVGAAVETGPAGRGKDRPPRPAACGTPTKGLVFYTDSRLDSMIALPVQRQLKKAADGLPIVSVSLAPLDFGRNIVLPLRRGILTMFKQILSGLEALNTDVAFLVEHDILYDPSHFDFTPPRDDVYWYNEHTYKVEAATGQALFYWTKQTSGLCANRQLLVEHYRRRIAKCEQNARDLRARGEKVKNDGFSRHMGFEPGCHSEPRGVDNYPAVRWMSEVPNIDIRHATNLTQSRWDPSEFRDPKACEGFRLVDEVPGWGVTKGRFTELLQAIG